MAQGTNMNSIGGTVDTPVGAQWPDAAGTAGSTDFGRVTEASDLASRSETLNAQPAPVSHVKASADFGDDEAATGRDVVIAQRPRSRPSTAAVLGSAVAGAVAGSAIPFMLAGRRSAGRSATAQDRADLLTAQADTERASSPSRWGRRWR